MRTAVTIYSVQFLSSNDGLLFVFFLIGAADLRLSLILTL